MIVVFLFSSACFANTINLGDNLGFETGTYLEEAYPAVFPYPWHGDTGVFIGADQGVTPYEGMRMFKFQYSNIYPSNLIGGACEVATNFDLTPYQEAINAGNATLDVSAYFNTANVRGVDYQYAMRLYFGNKKGTIYDFTKVESRSLYTDLDANTWQQLQAFTNYKIPADTKYMRVMMVAYQNYYKDGQFPEFLGNYADNVSIQMNIVPEPGTMATLLFGLAIPAVSLIRRRR